MVFSNFWPENIKKAFITLRALRLKLYSLNQTYIYSKSIIVQLTKTMFSDSAILIEKKNVESQLWARSNNFCRQIKMHHTVPWRPRCHPSSGHQ